ncbi:MAG: 2-dehydropantoate 2-reductase N-terminal domain-containing protein [Bacteroidales bacterium]
MKILVFGAGVIGTTYAWQLSEAGHDVSLLVRKQRMIRYSHSGVTISCTDMRGKKKEYVQTVFRPQTIDRLDPKSGFDLIIVAVKNFQLNDVVPYISQFSGNAHILFLGNLWNEFSLIEKHLPKGRFFFGFPDMAGGGRTDNSINCYLFRKSHTLLGEPNGKMTSRLKTVISLFESSGLQPKPVSNIVPWIKAHYIRPGATLGAVIKAGGARAFAENKKVISQLVKTMKEGFRVCQKAGTNPRKISPYSMFFLPLPISTWLLKKSFTREKQAVIDAHMKHGFDEMKKQYLDILHDGKKYGIEMPYWKSFEKYIQDAEGKQGHF